jgi:hypothetical protein
MNLSFSNKRRSKILYHSFPVSTVVCCVWHVVCLSMICTFAKGAVVKVEEKCRHAICFVRKFQHVRATLNMCALIQRLCFLASFCTQGDIDIRRGIPEPTSASCRIPVIIFEFRVTTSPPFFHPELQDFFRLMKPHVCISDFLKTSSFDSSNNCSKSLPLDFNLSVGTYFEMYQVRRPFFEPWRFWFFICSTNSHIQKVSSTE